MNKNAYIIDVESFIFPYHPSLQDLTMDQRKAIDDGHIIKSTTKILDFLKERNVKLTFAVVAEIYEWFPALIERIADEGHEIGYHGHHHKTIRSVEILDQELTESKKFLETFKPQFYQCPSIYFMKEGYAVLREAGFKYSNTVYQGMPYLIDGIVEMPASTVRPANPIKRRYPGHMTIPLVLTNPPFGSGLFTTLLPRNVLLRCYRKYQNLGLPTVTFIHDWQVVDMSGKRYPTLMRKLTSPLDIPYVFLNIWDKFCYLIDTIPFTTTASLYHDVKESFTGENI